ncbi:PREDICTED: alpha/beta-gliadin clone PW1215-like [Nicotiana attenuata]|uniref:alpha/beta-gliadin clone PW1215-like n=1 Tax=Nicotiana attenuata TaxID=49451 RepID=UPI0009048196|nr:PREDICTED: alpha/beta-gliadin clone PW1215-like [Nicotiana attenuata]
MAVSGSWHCPRGSPHHYTQPRPHPQTYTQAPYNPPQHYFPPPDPQYSVIPPQYHVHRAQSYAQPPPYPQWHAPAPQNPYPPPQTYRNPNGPSFRPRLEYRKERQQRKQTFTPLGEYARHDTKKCWHLKSAIQELIDTNQIVVQSPEAPNINQNPLPAHAEMHMIEIVYKDGEPKKPS